MKAHPDACHDPLYLPFSYDVLLAGNVVEGDFYAGGKEKEDTEIRLLAEADQGCFTGELHEHSLF